MSESQTPQKPKTNKPLNTRLIATGVFVVAVLVLVAVITSNLSSCGLGGITTERQQGSALSAEQAVKSFNISGLTYRYTNFIFQKDVHKIGDFEIPFTDKYLGVQYDGIMEIGVDGSLIKVAQTSDTITIKLPQAKILSHTQVNGSTKVLTDQSGIFNQNSVSDYIDLFDAEKVSMETRAEESGMFEGALANAKDQLRDLLNSLPDVKDKFTIVFE